LDRAESPENLKKRRLRTHLHWDAQAWVAEKGLTAEKSKSQ